MATHPDTEASLVPRRPGDTGGYSTSWLKIRNPEYSQMLSQRNVFEAGRVADYVGQQKGSSLIETPGQI
jgi:hypothetical protein